VIVFVEDFRMGFMIDYIAKDTFHILKLRLKNNLGKILSQLSFAKEFYTVLFLTQEKNQKKYGCN
jgi:hypothetical protein